MKIGASIVVWLLMVATAAAENRSQQAVRAIESRYRHSSTLKAAFFERYSDGKGGGAAESGTVSFSRPGRMRWEYESPEQKLFVVDGTNVWFYVPADRTASRAKMKESSDWRTPLALLTGKADLSRLCRTIDVADSAGAPARAGSDAPMQPGNTLLRCVPRGAPSDPDNPVREIYLESDAGANLVRVVIREAGNIETEFRFRNWEENISVPEAKFHFQPPPGVAVVDEESLSGEIR